MAYLWLFRINSFSDPLDTEEYSVVLEQKYKLAFKELKAVFTIAPVLTHWDLEAKIVVKTDISD